MKIIGTRNAAALAVTALAVAGLGACGGGSTDTPVTGSELNVGWSRPPDTLNPATTGARDMGPVTAATFETLVYLTPDLEATPGLATNWKISADAKTYTFDLRDDVTFHDGTPFNAEAVVANFEYITAKETQSTIALGLLGTCTDASATGEFQVKITCSTPYAPLLTQLGEPYLGMQSAKAIEEFGKDLGQHPTGTGPFKFENYTPNEKLVLSRYEEYDWAPEAADATGPAELEKLTFMFIPNNQSRTGALESGQVQVIQATPGVFYERYEGRYGLEPNPISGMGVYAPINASEWPTSDKSVRKAIAHALDREALIEAASAGAFPENQVPLTETILGSDETLAGQQEHDPEAAEQALSDGGWERQDDGWYKDGRKLELKITAISTSGTYPPIAQAMQANLAELGMEASVEEMGSAAWTDNNLEGNLNLTPLTYVAVDPDALSFWFMPDSFYNWSHYTNPELTKLLKQGRVESDVAKRETIYREVQQHILDENVIYPIYVNQDLLAFDKSVHGLAYTGGGFETFYGVTLSN